MEYKINVARPATDREIQFYGSNFVHYFKVIVQYGNVKRVYEELKEKFPDCEISVTVWQKIGKDVDMDKCDF